ncbi:MULTISPECIES: Imm43 family immunity protein [Lysinibacillus]|uniref:Imm43 family immunity protein n=1 Tax=Lysinibacillus irui TaxID=2998077 RepID=A0AAJ5RK00_9BACI|nr:MULTISPECIES: Imm43 family immunity protein [Lysinibacillus]MEA0563750.1 Imm43 family immunity protein [Lysinibacillus irui]WDV05444.1 Imm43 family immunity protein [Lysinibacillus irui]
MKYFMLVNNNAASPIYLDGVLHESFNEDKYEEGMSYNWNRPFIEQMEFPKELWLITRSKIQFDYYENFFGHIISEKFLSSMDQINVLQDYVIANLHVVSTKGKPKVKDSFCFIKCIKRHALVDYDKSEYLTREVPSNAKLKVDGSFVDKYIRLVLKDTDLDLFQLNDLKLGRYLFGSEKFKSLCEKGNLKGIQFMELELVPNYLQSIV